MPRVTGVRRDRRLNGKWSKGQGPNGQCKASVNPAAAASLSAANWLTNRRQSRWALGTIGRSDGPFRLDCPILRANRSSPVTIHTSHLRVNLVALIRASHPRGRPFQEAVFARSKPQLGNLDVDQL
jgi:hypothetical protein